MNRTLFVSFVALTLTLTATTPVEAQSGPMQKGISVQMVTTNNAAPESAADDQDAWIVTVTADGNLYFGATPVTPKSLTEEMKIHPRLRDAKLYVKADAHSSFAGVERVLEAAQINLFEGAVLLTSRSESASPEELVPPKGLEVSFNAPSDVEPVVVQLVGSNQAAPALKVNNVYISIHSLESTLIKSLQNRNDKVAVIKVAGATSFDHVAYVIDACYSTGARVILPSSSSQAEAN
jgi:biopolymer transport protein ExbD